MDGKGRSGLITASSADKKLMKKLLAVLIFGFAIVFNSFSAPTSAEQLRSEFEAAMKAKDTNTVLSLFNWQGVSDKLKSSMSRQIAYMVNQDVASVNLLPLPADRKLTNELDGVRYYPNVRVEGLIDIESTAKGNSSQINYGNSGGTFYIAGTLEETFDANAKKSTVLAVMVTGFFSKESPGILACSYVYVANAKENTDGFQCTNSLSKSFHGDYIKSCKVTKISGSGSYELEIHEGTNTVFDSDMVETNDSISYEKKN
jgi:hypothetical protein